LKSLEELALTTSDVTAVLPKVIAREVEKEARPKRYGRQLCRLNRDLVGRPGRTIDLPVRGAITAGRVSEGATSTIVKSAYSTIQVTPFKISTAFEVTQETINAMEMDVIEDFFEEAGHALADAEDLEIMRELISGATAVTDTFSGDGSTKKFALTKDLITEIVSVQVDAADEDAYTLDYVLGDIGFTAAPATGTDNIVVVYYYWADTRGAARVFEANTVQLFGLVDMTKGRETVRVQKFNPDVMVIPAELEDDILNNSQFVDASQYGGREGILRGEVGRIVGMRVLSTTQLFSGTVIYIDTSRCAKLVEKRDLEVKRDDLPGTDSFGIWIYQEFAPKLVNEGAIAIGVGHALDASAAVT
jgi:N4-gp56 family major capsid protein